MKLFTKTLSSILLLIVFFSFNQINSQTPDEAPYANQTVLQLSRALSKDIFDLNGVPFMQPLVEAMNSTSNARFVNAAYIPKQVDKAYFKISLNGMFGVVNNQQRTYTPQFPTEAFNPAILLDPSYIKFDSKIVNGQLESNITFIDSARLYHYLLKTVLYDAIRSGELVVPKESATILGKNSGNISFIDQNGNSVLIPSLNRRLDSVNNALGTLGLPPLSDTLANSLNGIFNALPSIFSLPPGGDYSSLFAGVPQIEIGSYYGTELLLRFIPPIKMSEEIGKFSFYGMGLKHNISQYFDDPAFDMAIQAVYQTTKLTNSVGVTNAELTANANMLNFNIQASKKIKDWFDFYTGLSYDQIDIDTRFSYFLASEIQGQVGLRKPVYGDPKEPTKITGWATDPANGYPGDKEPQVAQINLQSNAIKFTFGIKKQLGDFAIFADYNFANFNIFSAGIQYIINNPFIESEEN